MTTSYNLAPTFRVVFIGGPKDGDTLFLEFKDIPKVYTCAPPIGPAVVPYRRKPTRADQTVQMINYIRTEWHNDDTGVTWFEYKLEEQHNDS